MRDRRKAPTHAQTVSATEAEEMKDFVYRPKAIDDGQEIFSHVIGHPQIGRMVAVLKNGRIAQKTKSLREYLRPGANFGVRCIDSRNAFSESGTRAKSINGIRLRANEIP